MALQPVTYRPITAITPVSRKPDDEAVRKAAVESQKRPRRGRRPDPGQGENLDTWV